ncbi:isoprenylcysteine carboxylmethyltransferase family protein [Silicimonas algicola]|nr:isoprenylcysteine carboxylmethyltransferase family protein [Silicimonas algicola]
MRPMTDDHPLIAFPPPLAFAAALAATWLLSRYLPLGVLGRDVSGIGWVVMAAGLALAATGALTFRRRGTNVNPYKPALGIVATGPYRFTRNPMYLGMIVFTAGFGLTLVTLWGPIVAVGLGILLDVFVVRREEAYLSAKFGSDYTALCDRTRRWL